MANLGTQFECNPIGALAEAQATIARVTAERDEARAGKAALIEVAQFLLDRLAGVDGYTLTDGDAREWYGHVAPVISRLAAIALATEAETNALAEIVKRERDAETRACAEVVRYRRQGWLVPYILARLDQRKEKGE